ncbi:LysR family transcriptional regulator [Archangium violaceum]|uniref:LysR family transcriptional regulator n=1 Tax=Archangium violaceum TaxID=83451 RepID=UPI0019522935|nr:LysR family transcriptional regulator [Archangium violaceum]QRN94451.1 LysR family transcriptional regulator [Archangium violaceum]
MNWDDLRYLLTVERSGSLSAAARVLGVVTSTVGRRMTALERRLGTRLLARVPEGVRLTPEGRALVRTAAAIESQLHSAERGLKREEGQLEGPVRVTTGDGFVAFLNPLLARFREQHPGVRVELSADARLLDLARQEADLAVRTVRPKRDSLVARKVGQLAWRLYASARYLERAAPLRSPDDLAGHALVGFDAALSRMPQLRVLEEWGVGRFVFRSNAAMAVAGAVVAHQGVAALPCALASLYPELRPVLPDMELPLEDVWLVASREAHKVPRVRALMGFLAGRFEESRAVMLGVR